VTSNGISSFRSLWFPRQFQVFFLLTFKTKTALSRFYAVYLSRHRLIGDKHENHIRDFFAVEPVNAVLMVFF